MDVKHARHKTHINPTCFYDWYSGALVTNALVTCAFVHLCYNFTYGTSRCVGFIWYFCLGHVVA